MLTSMQKAQDLLSEAQQKIKEVEWNGPMAPGLDMYPDLRQTLHHLQIARTKLDAHIDNEGD